MASRVCPERIDAGTSRSRPLALLASGASVPAALSDISGAGAWLETGVALRPGERVVLRHAAAGAIEAEVIAQGRHGFRLAFDRTERSVGFALAAIAADMWR
ncbi:MAG TPA: hypothetical protein VFL92_07150 [Sphingomonas sp.]|nr:hypothetical protein [Sphingomonas sp.]